MATQTSSLPSRPSLFWRRFGRSLLAVAITGLMFMFVEGYFGVEEVLTEGVFWAIPLSLLAASLSLAFRGVESPVAAWTIACLVGLLLGLLWVYGLVLLLGDFVLLISVPVVPTGIVGGVAGLAPDVRIDGWPVRLLVPIAVAAAVAFVWIALLTAIR